MARPRLAVAPDGGYAIAFEALVEDISTAWHVAVQRYGPDAQPRGPLHLFDGESCGQFDIWTADGMFDPDLAFLSNGTLLIMMTHDGEWSVGSSGSFTAESTLGAITAQGELMDLNSTGGCVQRKLIFPGGGTQRRPRLAIGPNDAIYLIHQGTFDGAHFTNVALRVLDQEGNEVVEQFIPHADTRSQASFHQYPDLAVSAQTTLVTWHQCVLTDAQGSTNDCDIGLQVFDTATGQPRGGNVAVNETGQGQPGTYSIWPTVAMNASGAATIAWVDNRTGAQGDVFLQRYAPSGQPVGANIQVSLGQGTLQDRPDVAMRDDGQFMVVWGDSSAAGFQARARQFDALGQPIGAPIILTEAPSGQPQVAAVAGGYLTTWLEADAQGALAVRVQPQAIRVSTEPRPEVPATTVTLSAYPNPFAGTTTVAYELDRPETVQVTVYDLLGRAVTRLVDTTQPAGSHVVRWNAAWQPPGLYLVVVETPTGRATQRVVVTR